MPPPLAIVRLAIIPVTALFTVLVSGDGVGAAGSFNPENSSQYCAAGTGAIDDQQLSTSCTPDTTTGTHPDIASSFNLPAGDYAVDQPGDYRGELDLVQQWTSRILPQGQ